MGSESEAGWRRLDWDTAEVHPMVAGGFVLVVRGTWIPLEQVQLHRLPTGIAPEDYHGVEVRGIAKDPTLQVQEPWEVSLSTDGLSGRVGFVLLGATKRQHFPPRDDSSAS